MVSPRSAPLAWTTACLDRLQRLIPWTALRHGSPDSRPPGSAAKHTLDMLCAHHFSGPAKPAVLSVCNSGFSAPERQLFHDASFGEIPLSRGNRHGVRPLQGPLPVCPVLENTSQANALSRRLLENCPL